MISAEIVISARATVVSSLQMRAGKFVPPHTVARDPRRLTAADVLPLSIYGVRECLGHGPFSLTSPMCEECTDAWWAIQQAMRKDVYTYGVKLSQSRRLWLGPFATIDFLSYDGMWIQVHAHDIGPS